MRKLGVPVVAPFQELEQERRRNTADSDGVELSLVEVVSIAIAERWLVARASLAGLALGIVLAFALPSRYTATTTILPPQQSSSAGAALLSQLGSLGAVATLGGGLGLKNPNDMQVALLKSRVVEDAMIDRFHLMQEYKLKWRSDALKKLEKIVDIDSGAKDGLIRISVTDYNAECAAAMANAYVEEFRRRTARLAVTEAGQRRLFFEQQLTQAKDDLADAEEALKKTEQKTGLIQPDSQTRAQVELVARLRAEVSAKEVQLNALRAYATGENPEVQVAEQELSGLRSQLARLGGGSGNGDVLMPKGSLATPGLEYVRRLRDVKYYETIFDLLARQYEVAKVDEARQGAVVQVVDPAVAPDKRSSPKRLLMAAGGLILGFVSGLAWVLIRGAIRRIEANPAEQQRLAALRTALKT